MTYTVSTKVDNTLTKVQSQNDGGTGKDVKQSMMFYV